jgi:hypothetical protein
MAPLKGGCNMVEKDPIEHWALDKVKTKFSAEVRALGAGGEVLDKILFDDTDFDRLVGLMLPAELRKLGRRQYDVVNYFAVIINVEMTAEVTLPRRQTDLVNPRSGPAFSYSDRKKKS